MLMFWKTAIEIEIPKIQTQSGWDATKSKHELKCRVMKLSVVIMYHVCVETTLGAFNWYLVLFQCPAFSLAEFPYIEEIQLEKETKRTELELNMTIYGII